MWDDARQCGGRSTITAAWQVANGWFPGLVPYFSGFLMSDDQSRLFDSEPDPWNLDDQEDWNAARIVFADPPFGPYDYSIPPELQARLKPGFRVRVPLGPSRSMNGYCIGILTPGHPLANTVNPQRLKPVQKILDEHPLIEPGLLPVATWISEHYLCPLGSVIETVVPAGVRNSAGQREMTLLTLTDDVRLLESVKLTELQRRVVDVLRRSAGSMTASELAETADCTPAPVTLLRKKGILVATSRRVQRRTHEIPDEQREADLALNPDQQRALDAIAASIDAGLHRTFLMPGITGSGKTEVYIRAIRQTVAHGRQAIVLVPEISLTPQTRQRFRARFERVAVLHSHLTPAERNWHWREIAAGHVDVVIGARSAIFAPLPRPGLIVLDEEHDGSFKQDKAPRYHARDVAEWRARDAGVPLVLGSATPSLESYHRALTGRYDLLSLPRRVLNRPLPNVATIDMRADFSRGKAVHPISQKLRQEIRASLNQGGQVILLLNRRGFATRIQCPACGEAIYCPDCAIPLTHHRDGQKAVCHYCDYQVSEPEHCPKCGFQAIRFSGLGTQKLEQYVRALFPDDECMRMDTDTMKKPGSHEAALARFRSGEIRILLGTQMIAKGLDFPNVTLVGVINADSALHLADFRAAERTFSLVTQVAGRTGRGEKGGRVLVQTFSPEHPAIEFATRHDYVSFARSELLIRQRTGFPPFGQLLRVVVRSEIEQKASDSAQAIADAIRKRLDADLPAARILGPAPAPLTRLRGQYRFHLLLVAGPDSSPGALVGQATRKLDFPDDVQWMIDVDPMDLL